ncbi:ricin-type beta-trefoil lectin domain protein [Streptomyces sp. NBC_00727]|uniref:ricin-type beta-trefoil lectin domain protein n=1 Tax=Streptomyces sp. NBC_00727 TaxID=2903675 RepID=UPI003864CC9F
MAAVAVVTGVAVTAGGGSDSSSSRADAPAEGSVRPEDDVEAAGEQAPLPGVPTAGRTASPSATPSATASSSASGKKSRSTPGPGGSTASKGSGPSSGTDGSGRDSAAKPGSGSGSDSPEVHGFPLAVEASGKCLTAAGSGSQLVASVCDGSSGQSWTPGSDGSLRLGGQCVTVTGTEDRTPVVLAGCTGSSAQRIGLSGGTLVSASTGKCLDLFGGASGSQIVLWECNGRDNQHWSAA